MGGNALKQFGSTRLPSGEALLIGDRIKALIDETAVNAGRCVRCELIPSYRQKPDYGDVDLLVAGPLPEQWASELAKTLNPGVSDADLPVIRNGNVVSIGAPVRVNEVFQVDLILVPLEEFDFSLAYFSWNDVGNLTGRVAYKMGLKLADNGLWLPFRDGDRLFRSLLLTHDFGRAIEFLGFDPARWQAGFDTLEDIYRFIAESRYFDPAIYLLENRNHRSRVRDAKRPTYTGFLQWLQQHPPVSAFNAWPERKIDWLSRIFEHFPGTETAWRQADRDLVKAKMIRSKFNGEMIGRATGLSGKTLGALMSRIRHAFADNEQFESYVLEATENDVAELARQMQGANKPAS